MPEPNQTIPTQTEPTVTPPVEPTEPTNTTPAIDLSKLDNSTSEPDNTSNEPTVEELKAALEKEKIEKQKLKDSFDKKAREKAEAEKKAKELAAKANEPSEENARLKQELEEIKRETMKTSLTFTLSKEWGVSDELTSKMVASIFSDETGGFVEGEFRTAQLELIKSVREQARKEGYEQRQQEIMNGKPHSIGQQAASNVFDDVCNDLKSKKSIF